MNKLSEFIESSCTNDWLELDNMLVYVRKGQHICNGKLLHTFDIANISVHPDHQHEGIFTSFLEDVETLGLPVHVENVLTEQFANFFRKREGYEVLVEEYGMVSFLKE